MFLKSVQVSKYKSFPGRAVGTGEGIGELDNAKTQEIKAKAKRKRKRNASANASENTGNEGEGEKKRIR